MAPPRGDRLSKEGEWVKKSGAADAGGDEDGAQRGDRREQGRGRGRQPRERGRGRGGGEHPRERDVSGMAEDGMPVAESKGRGRGGRGGRGGRRGPLQETQVDEKDAEVVDEELSGSALLTMLKANPPKVTRYTKEMLLSISQLKASQMKPPDLNPLIDKENKDSQLLIRVGGGRGTGDGDDGGGEGTSRKDRRGDRRNDRRPERDEGDEGKADDAKSRRNQLRDVGNTVADVPASSDTPASASSTVPSVARSRPVGSMPPTAVGVGGGNASAASAPAVAATSAGGVTAATGVTTPTERHAGAGPSTVVGETEVDVTKGSRAFDKWFDREKVKQQTSASAGLSSNPAVPTMTAPSPGAAQPGAPPNVNLAATLAAVAAAAGSQQANAQAFLGGSLLHQQTPSAAQQTALGQAQAMQAAYMHAMSMHASSAAAGRLAYPGLPWGYPNPYLFPYGNPYPGAGAQGAGGAGYPSPLDYNAGAHALQAKLAVAAAYGLGQNPAAGRPADMTAAAGKTAKAAASLGAVGAGGPQGGRAAGGRQPVSGGGGGARKEGAQLAKPQPPGPIDATAPGEVHTSPLMKVDLAAATAATAVPPAPSSAARPANLLAQKEAGAEPKGEEEGDEGCTQS
eukprot:TRINITY_DN61224_c0_g1_i1.p1 TRINITY_DN61224_c0_g1~~TRINITY_DN61224_c0_g1_i1.p1  ORF type:complete len:664 (-),score=139.98 TRINITY_DN61224_c0_g1_i1:102-1979(-)